MKGFQEGYMGFLPLNNQKIYKIKTQTMTSNSPAKQISNIENKIPPD